MNHSFARQFALGLSFAFAFAFAACGDDPPSDQNRAPARMPSFDFNGDGFEDVVVGAPKDDDTGSFAGVAFIFFGGITPPATIDAGAADVRITGGDLGDNFAYSVSTAGDFNGDGFDDVIIGAPFADSAPLGVPGLAYIFFGSGMPSASLAIGDADVRFRGSANDDRFGWSVAGAGDVNGDGRDDVIVGAILDDDGGNDSGAAFVFYGSSGASGTVEASAANIHLVGGDANDGFGFVVNVAGDINRDGFSDVVVAAITDDDGGFNSGTVFVFFGGPGVGGIVDATAANMRLVGGAGNDAFGQSAAGAGDVNGDGFDDVIVGARHDDDGGIDSGSAFIFFGGSAVTGTIDASAADVRLVGGDAGDEFGYSVSGAGDFNSDGFADVIVGARFDDDGGLDAGAAFVFFGAASLPATIDASAAEVRLVGGDALDEFGYSVAGGGDFDDDEFDDVIVGARFDGDGGVKAGAAFVFLGATTPPATIDASVADTRLVGADADDQFGRSVGH